MSQQSPADLPVYSWFSDVPAGLLTRNQLSEKGLKPGGPVRGRVVWRHGRREAQLYNLTEATAKRPPTPAQLEAIERSRQARRQAREARERAIEEERERRAAERERYRDAMIAADHVAAIREAQELLALGERAVILDTETTDLGGYVVELGILGLDGSALLNTLIDPAEAISEGARAVHGIDEAMLKGAPRFSAVIAELDRILRDRVVISFSADFDRGILRNEIQRIHSTREQRILAFATSPWMSLQGWRCAMELYAQFLGCWSERHGNYRWFPLPGAGHRAIDDCRATLALLEDIARST